MIVNRTELTWADNKLEMNWYFEAEEAILIKCVVDFTAKAG